jgi:L-methionine (R)-S-oxide reductase
MAESLHIEKGTKEEMYLSLLPQIKALIGDETDQTAILSTVSAALKEYFDFFWVGFYLIKNNHLILGPFQGPIACLRIDKGRGVCGKSWETAETIIVADVNKFPGHIACSSFSQSEIVVPIIKNGGVIGVLDVDSEKLNNFDGIDANYLNQLCQWLSEKL